MAAAGDVCAGLIQHKATLLRELCDTNLLDVLVKKGLFNLNDLELITGAVDSDKCNYFIELVSKQSGLKLQELCAVLNNECPKLSKELMNDRHRYVINGYSTTHSAKENMVMNHNLNRRKRWLQVIGRPDLDNPKTNPKCYFVCSLHFEKYMITSKPILKSDAEPIKLLPNQPNHYVNTEEHKEASTQTTECYLNSLSVISDGLHAFPEVPIVKQEKQDEHIFQSVNIENIEITIPRIKKEYIENETESEATNQEGMHAEDTQTRVVKKIRGKTKEPRKARKLKPRLRKMIKESENKNKLLQIEIVKM